MFLSLEFNRRILSPYVSNSDVLCFNVRFRNCICQFFTVFSKPIWFLFRLRIIKKLLGVFCSKNQFIFAFSSWVNTRFYQNNTIKSETNCSILLKFEFLIRFSIEYRLEPATSPLHRRYSTREICNYKSFMQMGSRRAYGTNGG